MQKILNKLNVFYPPVEFPPKTLYIENNEPRSFHPGQRRHDAAPEQAFNFRAFTAGGGIVPL